VQDHFKLTKTAPDLLVLLNSASAAQFYADQLNARSRGRGN